MSDVQLTFSPGQTTQTFNVNTLDDNVLEDARERLFVAATTDDSSVTVSPDQASITILENDGNSQLHSYYNSTFFSEYVIAQVSLLDSQGTMR